MTKEGYVTVWHDAKSRIMPLISARVQFAVDKNGMKQKGFFDSSIATLRIEKKYGAEISIGDFVRLGKHYDNADRASDFKVMKIFSNLRGTAPHYRLVCER